MKKQLSTSVPAPADDNTTADAEAVPVPVPTWSPPASAATWSPSPAAPVTEVTSPQPKRSKKSKSTKKTPPATPLRSPMVTPSTPHNPSQLVQNCSPSSPLVLQPNPEYPSRAPPGFPVPIFGKDHVGRLPTCLVLDPQSSPRSDNLACLDRTFGGADKFPAEKEKSILQERFKNADLYSFSHDNFVMEMKNGILYKSGHGEMKCNHANCVQPGLFQQGVPNNCGFHRQWRYTDGFNSCGPECRGGFCDCLSPKYQADIFRLKFPEMFY